MPRSLTLSLAHVSSLSFRLYLPTNFPTPLACSSSRFPPSPSLLALFLSHTFSFLGFCKSSKRTRSHRRIPRFFTVLPFLSFFFLFLISPPPWFLHSILPFIFFSFLFGRDRTVRRGFFTIPRLCHPFHVLIPFVFFSFLFRFRNTVLHEDDQRRRGFRTPGKRGSFGSALTLVRSLSASAIAVLLL